MVAIFGLIYLGQTPLSPSYPSSILNLYSFKEISSPFSAPVQFSGFKLIVSFSVNDYCTVALFLIVLIYLDHAPWSLHRGPTQWSCTVVRTEV